MILLANIMTGLATVLKLILDLALIVIIARAVVSWFNLSPYHPLVRALSNMTDPVLFWIRRKFNLTFGGIDWSPMVVIAIIYFVQIAVVTSIAEYAVQLKAGLY